MGQKTHPLGIRIKAIENAFFFQKIGKFNIGSIFYSFYTFSFKNKSVFGRKLAFSFIIEKIINIFFLKILYFVNKINLTKYHSGEQYIYKIMATNDTLTFYTIGLAEKGREVKDYYEIMRQY